jgi:hypothetical protein
MDSERGLAEGSFNADSFQQVSLEMVKRGEVFETWYFSKYRPSS